MTATGKSRSHAITPCVYLKHGSYSHVTWRQACSATPLLNLEVLSKLTRDNGKIFLPLCKTGPEQGLQKFRSKMPIESASPHIVEPKGLSNIKSVLVPPPWKSLICWLQGDVTAGNELQSLPTRISAYRRKKSRLRYLTVDKVTNVMMLL